MNIPRELKFLTNNLNNHKRKVNVGDIVFFGYKSMESFYDRFPLVLVLSIKRGKGYSFLGFNLHYMPVEIRLLILDHIKNSGIDGAREMSRREIPRRFFTNAIKSYSFDNVITRIKVFSDSEITDVINTIIPIYDSRVEVDIIKYLDRVFVDEKRVNNKY